MSSQVKNTDVTAVSVGSVPVAYMNTDVAEDVSVGSVPVTIVSGFLGSGKTTLLRHILASPHGLKIAVIQNELSAAAGLEATTMVGPDGEEFAGWLELANGCVCCEVRDELVKGVETLMRVRGRFDYVRTSHTHTQFFFPAAATLCLTVLLWCHCMLTPRAQLRCDTRCWSKQLEWQIQALSLRASGCGTPPQRIYATPDPGWLRRFFLPGRLIASWSLRSSWMALSRWWTPSTFVATRATWRLAAR